MQLKIQRSQRVGGLASSTVFFCLDVRADYSAQEAADVQRYRLGGQLVYASRAARKHADNARARVETTRGAGGWTEVSGIARGFGSLALAKLQLNITVASLGRGHHIECKDLEELLEAEDELRSACKNVTRYFEVASTFNGAEVVIEYEKGEERVSVALNAAPILALPPPAKAQAGAYESPDVSDPLGIGAAWIRFEERAIGWCAERGWVLGPAKVRILSVATGILVLYILYRIL